MTAATIAQKVGYSEYYFHHLFKDISGIPPMSYVTWRKLQYALYDLTTGKKIIGVAMEYGFETHAGFTKAFKRVFGFQPYLCALRLTADPPTSITV